MIRFCCDDSKLLNRLLHLSVAQPDNASDSDSEDYGFESRRADHFFDIIRRFGKIYVKFS